MADHGACALQQPQIILLKDGTDTSQGKAQLISNINACMALVDAVRTTLGPRGMDKLIHTPQVHVQLQVVKPWTTCSPVANVCAVLAGRDHIQ